MKPIVSSERVLVSMKLMETGEKARSKDALWVDFVSWLRKETCVS